MPYITYITTLGRNIPIAAPRPARIEVFTASKKIPAYITIRIINPNDIGFLTPLATAFSIEALIICKLISEAHTPKTKPYGNTTLKPINGNEATSIIAATIIVVIVTSFFIVLIVVSSFFEITPNSILVLYRSQAPAGINYEILQTR